MDIEEFRKRWARADRFGFTIAELREARDLPLTDRERKDLEAGIRRVEATLAGVRRKYARQRNDV